MVPERLPPKLRHFVVAALTPPTVAGGPFLLDPEVARVEGVAESLFLVDGKITDLAPAVCLEGF